MVMANNDPFLQNEIIYRDDTHQYFNLKQEEYKSVSRALKGIQVPFNSGQMSAIMAKKIAFETGISEKQAQQELLAEWESKKDGSIDKGNYVHDSLERYAIKGTCDDEMKEATEFLLKILKEHYRYFPETIIHSHTYKMAGRTDLALMRQKSKVPILDFIDYKSNIEKGIQFDSINRKTDPLRHYNRFLLPPFDYLEDCNYNTYSLQLSIYAFMAMERLHVKIGRLGILFIDNDFKPSLIPVPFMYQEAKAICEMNIQLKALPQQELPVKESQGKFVDIPASVIGEVVFNNGSINVTDIKEDW
jgi:hypothetical protein